MYSVNMMKIAIIGGGITGLSAAYYLSKASQLIKVTHDFYFDVLL